jgi:hypothetical protein
VPAALALFIALYLFLVFVALTIPAAIFVLLLVLFNGVALWLTFLFLKRTAFYKKNREKINAK